MTFQAFFKGWLGEQGTNIIQGLALDPKIYRTFYDIFVEGEAKQTQIDHVIISKFGIFVVETKNWAGWIFGNENDEYWTVIFPDRRTTYQNPLRQNELHIRSLAHFCEVQPEEIFSVIVIWGDSEFKTKMPKNVVTWLQYPLYINGNFEIISEPNKGSFF